MKTNVKLLSAIALIASACTTGSMVTSSGYTDDIYYSPGDNPPVVVNSSSSGIRPAGSLWNEGGSTTMAPPCFSHERRRWGALATPGEGKGGRS